MKKYERTTSYRFSEDTYQKLDLIYESRKKDSDRMKLKPVNRNQIVEEAIRDLYFKMINETQDGDVVDRVGRMVEDRVNVSMNNLHKKIDEILYYAIKNDYGNKLLFRSPSIIPPAPSILDCIKIISEEESGWNNALEEFMFSEINKGNDKYHTK